MKLIALTELPDKTPKGRVFEENAIMGALLIQCGVAREYLADDEAHDVSPTELAALVEDVRPKRRYRRRDLVPDE